VIDMDEWTPGARGPWENTMREEFLVQCWICNKPVRLQDCKTDDRGRPVHEECYVILTMGEQYKIASGF
jgi:hypothetical protein